MNINDVKKIVNIRDEFHFHFSVVSDVTYFAQDPLRSYFDERQKNEIHFLNNKVTT